MKNNPWIKLLLLIGIILGFYVLDRWILEVTVAPLLAILMMFALSLFLSPIQLVAVLVILIPYVVISIVNQPEFDWNRSADTARLWVRTLSFSVAGVIAVVASHFRRSTREMLKQTLELLKSIPIPILLSEGQGRVVWANHAAQRLCGTRPVEGRLYEEVLPIDRRPFSYALLFDNPEAALDYTTAMPGHLLRFIPLSGAGRRLLATVVLPEPSKTLLSAKKGDVP